LPAWAAEQPESEALAVVGSIRGNISDENGDPVPEGKIDLFNQDGAFLNTYAANSSGNYTTGPIEEGTYYVLLYNGDDENFIGWFPQWYAGATLLRGDLADGVTLTAGNEDNINAQLIPLFDDMFDSVFKDNIAWMQYTGITQGCATALYCVSDPVTRGQMAAFLVRALEYSDNGGGDLYTDDNDSVFEDAIDKLGTAGVTQGCNPPSNTRFCPERLVTRGQMAAFLVRALGYTDNGGGNHFADDNGSIFEDAIDKLRTAGVTLGCNPPSNTRFCPEDPVTRGQMAAFLERALGSFYGPAGSEQSLSSPQIRSITK
jgi:hypothetical protein